MVILNHDIEKQSKETCSDVATDPVSSSAIRKEEECAPATSSSSETEKDDSGSVAPEEKTYRNPNESGSFVPNSTAAIVSGSPHPVQGRRTSSYELRCVPVDVLFKPSPSEIASILSDDDLPGSKREGSVGITTDFMHRCCLRPGYTLKTQMMLSFGTINLITIIFVVAICIILAEVAGKNVYQEAGETFELLGLETQGKTSRYLAEALTPRLAPLGLLNLMREGTIDRYSGYPDPTDSQVPFRDKVTGNNKYPVVGQPMPLQWDLDSNLSPESSNEHVQSRWDYYKNRPANTVNAGFHFQATCNPNATKESEPGYLEGCTDANNELSTGGVVAPSNLTEMIHRKGSDIVPIFRMLFETREDVRDMGVYFSNHGAGASITYPHYTLVPNSSYVSTGCEWMKIANPYDKSRPIGTQEMIENCHEEGSLVDSREYNPMERQWCIDQALNPYDVIASIGPDAWDNGNWLMFFGKAIYDESTKEFVGCTYVGTSLHTVDDELTEAKVTPMSNMFIATWNEKGTVVASSRDQTGDQDADIRAQPIYEIHDGVTQDKFEELLHIVDYDSLWDPVEVRHTYENFTYQSDRYFVSGYPIPSIPNEYDPSYKPYFLLFSTIPEEDVFKELNGVGEIVDNQVTAVTIWSVVAGVIGLLISTLIIVLMANMLTSPLRSMNEVAKEIVDNFGDPSKEHVIVESGDLISKESRCTPKTELSDVVKEFNKLVKSFSGSSMAKSETGKHTEVENLFTFTKAFSELYSLRNDGSFKYKIEPPHIGDFDFINLGSNLRYAATTATTHVNTTKPSNPRRFSPLFLWTVGLIVTPLIITSVIISAVVMHSIKESFSEGMNDAKVYLVGFQANALSVHARLRSDLVSEITSESTNELHVLTRISEWLLFGALGRADSLTAITSGQEECKSYENVSLCPWVIENTHCSCAFNDTACKQLSWPARNSQFQDVHFTCQASGANADGDRNSSGSPDNVFSIEGVEWWDDLETVPGWEKGENASGHETTYDRLRVISAVPVFQALYNYNPLSGTKLGSHIGFEADGCFLAYGDSCTRADTHIRIARWQATKANGAARLRPDLCPLGKIGYDPRCRGWYDTGRKLALNNDTALHITSPYLFATDADGEAFFAQSATAPLIDPRSGEYVGQTLIDFRADDVYDVLNEMEVMSGGGFPILITSQGESDKDTVVAPGFTVSDDAKPIAELLLPIERRCKSSDCEFRLSAFDVILNSMKAGESSVRNFTRLTETGALETVYLAYAPVTVRNTESVNSSEYSRGVEVSKYQVYVLGLGGTDSVILKPFNAIKESTEKQMRVAIGIVSALLVVAAVVVAFISQKLTRSITEPMLYLLELIRSLNRHGVDKDPPDLKTVKASQEIVTFSYTMEMLFKAMRSANAAFYAGALEAAFLVLVDALRLFKRLDNKKAIGIASNNLGNTMLAMYREMQLEDLPEIAGLTKKKVLVKGIAYFHEAIQLGEKAYDEFYNEQGWTPICLDFMQHLANRYFNRGLFLLTVKDSHETPKECERLGLRDLEIARDMDLEVISYGEEIGWASSDRPAKLFDVMLVRLRGFNMLLSLGYPDVWEVEEQFEEAFELLRSERKRDSSDLFTTVSVAGRLQEIETELMKFKMYSGDIRTAAKVAIRMLREDEKVFIDGEAQAVNVILKYLEEEKDSDLDDGKEVLKTDLEAYKNMLEDMVDDRKRAAIDDLESDAALSRSTRISDRMCSDHVGSSRWTLNSSSGRFVTMENF